MKTIVFIDECFIELVPTSNESVISYVKKYDNLFILRSLTKSFGLPGLRIGYACGSKEIIKILQKIKNSLECKFFSTRCSKYCN